MARDKITVDLILATKQAEREIAKINRKFGDMGKAMGKAFGGAGGGGDKIRALGTGLSKATVKADEFSKSLEASNARVIAFGASAGLIMGVDRALKAMVASALKVEKALMDVNIVMDLNNKQLEKFGKGMFKVAKETAQAFETVAEAGVELARQGLGTEKTLLRTKDALILTRLTGMNAADAVKTLTAAVNSFNKEGVTSSEVINRMAKVDAKFAVSSEDLAKSISRVGASAVSAGVNMNELMAITTAVQQRTARGGAVIGNAFKTIFTRIQRSEVQQKLTNIGVATRDMQGNMLSGIKVLQNLAGQFDKLTRSQQATISENVAGVFQVNILKAALADLSQETSAYSGALRAANSATDEAYTKNERLNQTLDSLVNRTLANLTQAGATLGGGLFGPAIENILGTVNGIIDAFGEGGKFEKFGEGFGSDIIKGMGKFIGGPGLIMATAVFAKLAMSLGKFAKQALMDVVGINNATKQRVALEEAVVKTIAKEPHLLNQIRSGTLNVLEVEQSILNTIKAQTAERARMQSYARPIAGALYGRGARVGSRGTTIGRGRADGFVPNFADAGSERAAAAAGGYTAGSIRTMSQPGAGTMMYNSAETVKRFPGMSQSAIMPPQGSPAGAGYKAAFGAAHGFDPYAASGFVPNFAFGLGSKFGIGKGQQMPKTAGHFQTIGASKQAKGADRQLFNDFRTAGGHIQVKKNAFAMLIPKLGYQNLAFTGVGRKENKKWTATFPSIGYSNSWARKNKKNPPGDIEDMMLSAAAGAAANVSASLVPPGTNWDKDTFKAAIAGTLEPGHPGFGIKGAMGAINSAAGAAFETGVLASMHLSASDPKNKGNTLADWDVFNPNKDVKSLFGGGGIPWKKGDLKISDRESPVDSMVNKLINELLTNGARGNDLTYTSNLEKEGGVMRDPTKKFAFQRRLSSERPGYEGMLKNKRIRYGTPGAARGYVPNFASALSNSVGREMMAGVPASAIRVGTNPALRSAGNPGGVGVYNTIHEPAGLSQGIRRSQRSGIDPTMHGAASGFVPNFGLGLAKFGIKHLGRSRFEKVQGFGKRVGQGGAGIGALGLMGAMDNPLVNIASSAAMGAAFGGGVPGAVIGGALGIVTEAIKLFTGAADEAGDALDTETDSQLSLAKASEKASENIEALKNKLDAVSVRNVVDITKTTYSGAKDFKSLGIGGTEEFKALEGATSVKQLENLKTKLDTRIASKQKLASLTGDRTSLIPTSEAVNKQVGEGITRYMSTGALSPYMGNDIRQLEFREEQRKKFINSLQFTAEKDAFKKPDPELIKGLISNLGLIGKEGERAGFEALYNRGITAQGISDFSMEDMLGALLGLQGAEARQLVQGDLVGENKGLSALGSEGFDALRDHLVNIFADSDRYNEVLKRLIATQQGIDEEAGNFQKILIEANAGQEALRKFAHEVRLSSKELAREVAHRKKMTGFETAQAVAIENATMTRAAAIPAARQRALDENRKVFGIGGEKERIARKKFEESVAGGLGKQDFVKFAAGQGFTAETGRQALADLQTLQSKLTINKDGKITGVKEGSEAEIARLRQKMLGLTGGKMIKGVIDPTDAASFKFLPETIKMLDKAFKDLDGAVIANADDLTKSNQLAEKKFETDKKSLALQYEYNKARAQEQRVIEASLAGHQLKDAGERMRGGKLGARGYASAYSAKLARDVAADGVQPGDFNRAFRAGFVNEMGYEPVDMLEDWEAGTRSVAQNMKSSFSDAFKSIASGADSVQGALANMASSILDSISDVSNQMMTNMLFSKMGGGAGRYASGGVVTGGSGYKDDVPTMMSGGEYVIKKSSAQKIGYGTLNAINSGGMPGFQSGGPSMGSMFAVSAAASAASGFLNRSGGSGKKKPWRGQNYGHGRGAHGYFGGPDPDAGGGSSFAGGRNAAQVSLNKAYVYYRRDPKTGRLISEKARPTEGRYEVSSALSLAGRLGSEDPQTARMFGKETKMGSYSDYLFTETARRKAVIKAHEKQKRQRLVGAYMNAAMLMGGSYLMGKTGAGRAVGEIGSVDSPVQMGAPSSAELAYLQNYPPGQGFREYANGGSVGGSPALLTGGEFIMNAGTVRQHGLGFMGELNRGKMPGMAAGGPVGGVVGGGVGSVNNNVSVNVNIDRRGNADASTSPETSTDNTSSENSAADAQKNKDLGVALQTVVLQEIMKQQRPGGLLQGKPYAT